MACNLQVVNYENLLFRPTADSEIASLASKLDARCVQFVLVRFPSPNEAHFKAMNNS